MTSDPPSPSAGSARILFWVQHLLGIGHVRRAAALARALADAGGEVMVAEGGFPVPGTDWGKATVLALPPARAADASFRPIVGEDGRPIDSAWKKRRAAALLQLAAQFAPDAILTETYPLGRRAFRFELRPMLEIARRRSPDLLVAASVRDILVSGDPEKDADLAAEARRFFDLILVHGDPAVLPLEASFPPATGLAELIRYTGYVGGGEGPPPPAGDGEDEVLVSAGGGAVGLDLLRTAIACRPMSKLRAKRWRILAGPDIGDSAFAALGREAGSDLIVERARPDFRGLLRRCRLSISQAGYNTAVDLMATGTPAVLVPFAAGQETEQTVRAGLMERRDLAVSVAEHGLTPAALAAAVNRAADLPRRAPGGQLDGATVATREIISSLHRKRRIIVRGGV